MVIKHNESARMQMTGTVIDLETIGEFDRQYHYSDTRQYAKLKPTIFGYLSGNNLVQYCAEGPADISNVVKKMNEILPTLETPFYALNCNFEKGVCTHSCTHTPEPLLDVRGGNTFEKKWDARARLGIPTYDDPFNGEGYTCVLEWQKNNYIDCLKHNRACLLIERDILERTVKQ